MLLRRPNGRSGSGRGHQYGQGALLPARVAGSTEWQIAVLPRDRPFAPSDFALAPLAAPAPTTERSLAQGEAPQACGSARPDQRVAVIDRDEVGVDRR